MEQDLRYPIGRYEPKPFSQAQKEEWLTDIQFLPQALEHAVSNLDEAQLQTPYREGGWTVHQLVHHVADSHLNAYCRFKLGYTEEKPAIRTYEEKLWAETADVKTLPINVSLTLLHALHKRWYEFLKSFSDNDFARTVYHPEHKKEFTLWHLLGMYAWHGRHHAAHITSLRERKGWN
ncbi:YfiT family bacillithiol transferase [Flavisolibacter ginsenosidimutans]|uniref:Putative metal-dependent hydrolase n=1 Tax=Flavisolibacter ginsenosidimutans TaxID=661481 RepID=A0A5B8UER6_9BACT|nr:bacillithiol transferase BstA [Flavisolibacter ginsenosidimutans]QEC54998.1 putative metal-dependent hydrolase [Flavisolibacter ginsenosidimutans]